MGQDLQAGNLSKAQSDFSVLSQNFGGSLQGNSALAQAFGSLEPLCNPETCLLLKPHIPRSRRTFIS